MVMFSEENIKNLPYFSEGHNNKLYFYEKDGVKYVIRTGLKDISGIYQYSNDFTAFIGSNISVVNFNTISYKYIDGKRLVDEINHISTFNEKKLFYDFGKKLSQVHSKTNDYFVYSGIKFKDWIQQNWAENRELANKNRHISTYK